MEFDFSDDQKQLKDQARRFLEAKSSPKAVRVILEGREPYDKALWKGLAEMGFMGTAIPEEFGGLGATYLELCVIAEELGRAVAPVPFSSSIFVAAELLMAAGTQAQKETYLPKLASGELIGCLAPQTSLSSRRAQVQAQTHAAFRFSSSISRARASAAAMSRRLTRHVSKPL